MKTVLALTAAMLLLPLAPALVEHLAYDRAAVVAGEWWRFATCQLTHWGWSHALWNVGAFAALGVAAVRLSPRAAAWTIGAGFLAIPLLVAARDPGLVAYRGVSGVVTALFAYVAWEAAARTSGGRRALVLAVVGLLVAKVGWEAKYGRALFADDLAFVVSPTAHAAGALLGALVGAARCLELRDLRVAWNVHPYQGHPFRGDSLGPRDPR